MITIIPCAGKSTRFNYKNKALVDLYGRTIIERLIKHVKPYISEIIVVVHSSYKNQFSNILCDYDNVKIVTDDSYGGNAVAVKTAITNCRYPEDILVIWGDTVYQSEGFLCDFLRKYNQCAGYAMYIPVQFQIKPYLAILLDEDGAPCDVFFSREESYRIKSGYHDLSTYIVRCRVLRYLYALRPIRNGEERFLDLVKILYKKGEKIKLFEFSNDPVLSFNTSSELRKVLKRFSPENLIKINTKSINH